MSDSSPYRFVPENLKTFDDEPDGKLKPAAGAQEINGNYGAIGITLPFKEWTITNEPTIDYKYGIPFQYNEYFTPVVPERYRKDDSVNAPEKEPDKPILVNFEPNPGVPGSQEGLSAFLIKYESLQAREISV